MGDTEPQLASPLESGRASNPPGTLPMIHVAAVILAGGRGERLGGVVKANLTIGGVRLLERVSRALGPLPGPVIVAHGALPPDALNLLPGQAPVADLKAEYAGPLAGLAAAADYCLALGHPRQALLTVAVDTPFVPADYAARMASALEDAAVPAVVARHAGQDYPTNAIWRLSAIADLPDTVRARTAPHSLKCLAATIGAAALDWPGTAAGDPFANINTPEDLNALEARATAYPYP